MARSSQGFENVSPSKYFAGLQEVALRLVVAAQLQRRLAQVAEVGDLHRQVVGADLGHELAEDPVRLLGVAGLVLHGAEGVEGGEPVVHVGGGEGLRDLGAGLGKAPQLHERPAVVDRQIGVVEAVAERQQPQRLRRPGPSGGRSR